MDRPSSRTRAVGPALSLEASLDEENREVLAALDRRRPRSPMPKINRNATPPPPVRSMLDVDSPTPRHGSIAGIGVGITSPNQQNRKFRLDPSDPSTYTSPHASKPNSPTLNRSSPVATRTRNVSDPNKGSHVGLPRIGSESKRGFEQDYQFDMASIPSSTGGSIRSPAETKRTREGSGGAAATLAGEMSMHVGKPAGHSARHNSTAATGTSSRSPSSRIRSPASPQPELLSPIRQPGNYVTEKGTIVDDTAHRRLSSKSTSFSTVNTEELEEVSGRVVKDGAGEEEALEEYSDEDDGSASSDEDESRGRNRRSRKKENSAEGDSLSPDPSKPSKTQDSQNPTSSPEPEKKPVSQSQTIRSLLEPSISVTAPSGEKATETTGEVHPASNSGPAGPASSAGSGEDDDLEAIRKAKTLALNISPLDSRVQDRHVRMIIRGNWKKFHDDADAGLRTARTYLTCSDLSTEANYALEWTVGTLMRDGDTLLAIYAIEDETAGKPTEADREIYQAEGVKAGKDASEVMEALTKQTTKDGGPGSGVTNKYVPATEMQSLTGSVDARKVSKKEMERLRAIDEITQNFLRLVRKTTLQVRCMIEVIHCSSPKHLILGAIDELNPTLTVVGTRGRNSLKGVLLGSFSNYLVTKSSAPVMVARKKLKKPKSQIRVSSTKIRLTNNLTAMSLPVKRRSLTQARID